MGTRKSPSFPGDRRFGCDRYRAWYSPRIGFLDSEQNDLSAAADPAAAAALQSRLAAEEPRRVRLGSFDGGPMGHGHGIGVRRRIERVLHRLASESNELAGDFELAIFGAEAFELETE